MGGCRGTEGRAGKGLGGRRGEGRGVGEEGKGVRGGKRKAVEGWE